MPIRILVFIAGLLALLAVTACGGEPASPEQVTKEAQEQAQETYNKQVKEAGEAELSDRAEVESFLALSSISAGGVFACGLEADGNAVCWGAEFAYEGFSGSFASVDAGEYHVCGTKSDGSVQCAGRNTNSVTGRTVTGQADSPSGSFKAVSSGMNHTCGITTDDSVSCWGWERDGLTSSPSGQFKVVDAGGWHSLRYQDGRHCRVLGQR